MPERVADQRCRASLGLVLSWIPRISPADSGPRGACLRHVCLRDAAACLPCHHRIRYTLAPTPLPPTRCTRHADQAHEAEQPDLLRPLTVPLLNAVQGGLRKYGQPVFDALANPSTVKTILKEPYADAEQVATGWTYSLG